MVVACTVNRNIMRAVRGGRYRLEPRAQKERKIVLRERLRGLPVLQLLQRSGRRVEKTRRRQKQKKQRNFIIIIVTFVPPWKKIPAQFAWGFFISFRVENSCLFQFYEIVEKRRSVGVKHAGVVCRFFIEVVVFAKFFAGRIHKKRHGIS